MNFYQDNNAPPLKDYSYKEVKSTLSSWKDFLRTDLECLIYVKQSISTALEKNSYDDIEQGNKIIQLIPKLEALCIKGIECINEFIKEITNKGEPTVDKMYCKVETIRENYNKIVTNIHKMITTAPNIQNYIGIYHSKQTQNENIVTSTISPIHNNSRNIIKQSINTPLFSEENTNKCVSKLYKDIDLFQSIHSPRLNQNNIQKTNIQNQHKDKRPFNKTFPSNNKNDNTKPNTHHKEMKHPSDKIVRLKSISPKERINTTISTNKSNYNINTYYDSIVTTTATRDYSRQRSSKNKGTINKGMYKKLYDEIKYIKSFIERIEMEFQSHCIVSKEKENFESLKKENVKLMVDVNILKEDMIDVMKKVQELNTRIGLLEKENNELKIKNDDLMTVIRDYSQKEDNVKESRNQYKQFQEFKGITLDLEDLNRIKNEHYNELNSHREYEYLNTFPTNCSNNYNTLNSSSNRFCENSVSVFPRNQHVIQQKLCSTDKPKRFLIPKKNE